MKGGKEINEDIERLKIITQSPREDWRILLLEYWI